MARYILGSRFRASSARRPWLRQGLWWLDRALVGGVLQVLGWLSVERASRAGRRLGMWLGPKLPKHRYVRANLRLAFPQLPAPRIDQLAREVWGNFGAVLAEYPHLATICIHEANERLLISPAPPELAVFTDPGKPAVFVGAHLANWEVCAAALARMGVQGTALYTRPQNPWAESMLARWRKHLGWQLLARQDSLRPLLRELRQGRSVALLADRRVDNGVPLPFFGVDRPTTLLPARLALRFGCELIPIRAERLGDARFRVTIYPAIAPDASTAVEEEKAIQMMRKVNTLYEEWIRAAPQDWFCSKRGTERRSRPLPPVPQDTRESRPSKR